MCFEWLWIIHYGVIGVIYISVLIVHTLYDIEAWLILYINMGWMLIHFLLVSYINVVSIYSILDIITMVILHIIMA